MRIPGKLITVVGAAGIVGSLTVGAHSLNSAYWYSDKADRLRTNEKLTQNDCYVIMDAKSKLESEWGRYQLEHRFDYFESEYRGSLKELNAKKEACKRSLDGIERSRENASGKYVSSRNNSLNAFFGLFGSLYVVLLGKVIEEYKEIELKRQKIEGVQLSLNF